MSTRSTIALEYADGTVDQIYCHWNGYLEYNGDILLNHYSDPFKLQKLMDLGDISVLMEEIGEKHDFDDPTPGWTLAYGRDRGEDTYRRRLTSFEEYLQSRQVEDFNYILRQVDGNPVWFYSEGESEIFTQLNQDKIDFSF